MSTVILSELHHWSSLKKRGMPWIFICFTLSGIHSLVTVNQHPVVVTSLADEVILHCELTLSPEERMTKIPVLYWEFLKSDTPGMWPKVWPVSQKYVGRVERLDNINSPNKSVRLRNVQWEDSGMYQCKLSITTEKKGSERKRGNSTMLLVYDSVSLNTTDDDTQLQCAVRVSWDPGFVLSISHIGPNQTIEFIAKNCNPPLLQSPTLSVIIPLMKSGVYECQLHLNSTLITKNTFSHNLTDELMVYPQPWLLYVAMLLVPFTLLLGVTTVLLILRH